MHRPVIITARATAAMPRASGVHRIKVATRRSRALAIATRAIPGAVAEIGTHRAPGRYYFDVQQIAPYPDAEQPGIMEQGARMADVAEGFDYGSRHDR